MAYGGYGIGPNPSGAESEATESTYKFWVSGQHHRTPSTTCWKLLLLGDRQLLATFHMKKDVQLPDYGIDGWPNYQGTWRIEVDAVKPDTKATDRSQLHQDYCLVKATT